jgi:hypothetical protein
VQTASPPQSRALLLFIMMLLLCTGFIPGLIWWMILLRGNDAQV